MTDSKHIVITGSTRGIGYGLADAFLAQGCSVTISGRSPQSTASAVDKLSQKHEPRKTFGLACDVTIPLQVQALWDESLARIGHVDIWVNNAGHSGNMGMVWERPAEELESVISTNLIGLTYGSQVAVRGMLAQGHGAIYNMEGMGSDGRKHAGLTMYGTSKYAVHYFTQSLALELKDTPIIVGALRPGMVITDMILNRYRDRPQDLERVRRIFNIIADRVENVTPWLVERILNNHKNGATIAYSSTPKLLWRFISSPFTKRNVFD
jgi:NAD(P)-dependent dehydrogenase (short-subunit alcohol dehydrogenase family)